MPECAAESMAVDQTLIYERKGKSGENEESRRWSLTSVNHIFLLRGCQLSLQRDTCGLELLESYDVN